MIYLFCFLFVKLLCEVPMPETVVNSYVKLMKCWGKTLLKSANLHTLNEKKKFFFISFFLNKTKQQLKTYLIAANEI